MMSSNMRKISIYVKIVTSVYKVLSLNDGFFNNIMYDIKGENNAIL